MQQCRHVSEDKRFCIEQLSRLNKRPKKTIQRFLDKLGAILNADEIYCVTSADVAKNTPPHRTLWNKMAVLNPYDESEDQDLDPDAVDPKKQAKCSQSLFRVGLDSSFITSMVEGTTQNRSSTESSARGSVLCIPLFNDAASLYPFGACYLVRYETMNSVIRNLRNGRNEAEIEQESIPDSCALCEMERTLTTDGTFDHSCVERCEQLVRCGQKFIYRAIKRKQRPTSARPSHSTHTVTQENDVPRVNLKKEDTDEIYRALKQQNLRELVIISGKSSKFAAAATMGPPPPKISSTRSSAAPRKELETAAAAKKRRKKKRRKNIKSKPRGAVDVEDVEDVAEEWKVPLIDGWGVRHAQSAAVRVHSKHRLVAKTQQVRPVTLAGTKKTSYLTGLSGKRRGFMNWIHGAAKAQKRKVMRMKKTTLKEEGTTRQQRSKQTAVVPLGTVAARDSFQLQRRKLRKRTSSMRSSAAVNCQGVVGGRGVGGVKLPLLYA